MSVAVRVSRPTLEASFMARDIAENMPRRGERGGIKDGVDEA